MSVLDNINMMRQQLDLKNIAEDMAYMVMRDLEEAGFKAELKKYGKNPRKWRIIPIDELSSEEMERFNEIKEKRVDHWRDETMNNLKKMRKEMM